MNMNSGKSLNIGMSDYQDERHNGCHMLFCTLTESTVTRFLPNDIHGLLSSNKVPRSIMGSCATNNNEDGQQFGHRLSICICGYSNLVNMSLP